MQGFLIFDDVVCHMPFSHRQPSLKLNSSFNLTVMASMLKKENEQLQQEINKLQQKLSTVVIEDKHVEPDTSQFHDELPCTLHIDILRQKCKQLRAQLDHTEARQYKVLPDNETIQYDQLINGLRKTISQTKEILKFQDNLKKEIQEKTDREKKVNEELKAVVDAASARCKIIETEKTSKEQVCGRLRAKCKQLDKLNGQMRKDIREFIRKYYPLPDIKLFNSVKKKVNFCKDGVELKDLTSLLPLNDIIEILMKTNADNPNNPYVELDHRFWPPYIELLQEVDLIIRHPTDPGSRIKLVPIHL